MDSTTGLTWEKSESSGAPITGNTEETTSANAAHCASLSLGGRCSRLLTFDELATMVDLLPATGRYSSQRDARDPSYSCLGASSTANNVRALSKLY